MDGCARACAHSCNWDVIEDLDEVLFFFYHFENEDKKSENPLHIDSSWIIRSKLKREFVHFDFFSHPSFDCPTHWKPFNVSVAFSISFSLAEFGNECVKFMEQANQAHREQRLCPMRENPFRVRHYESLIMLVSRSHSAMILTRRWQKVNN